MVLQIRVFLLVVIMKEATLRLDVPWEASRRLVSYESGDLIWRSVAMTFFRHSLAITFAFDMQSCSTLMQRTGTIRFSFCFYLRGIIGEGVDLSMPSEASRRLASDHGAAPWDRADDLLFAPFS